MGHSANKHIWVMLTQTISHLADMDVVVTFEAFPNGCWGISLPQLLVATSLLGGPYHEQVCKTETLYAGQTVLQ